MKKKKYVVSKKEQEKRKRYFNALLVTCAALAMVGGSIHVVELGANRMADMRSKATYDLANMADHIRAAGEDITRSNSNKERTQVISVVYQQDELQAMLSAEAWADLDSMVLIPAGEFLMGSDRAQTGLQNRPQHSVSLPTYRIDKYPVTNIQYARFVSAINYRPPLDWTEGLIPAGKKLHAVTMVSWYDGSNYCNWAAKRLPSELEWEKAARGVNGQRWPWGEHMDITRLNTYYANGSTLDVTAFPQGASPYGVMEMAGNVSEWMVNDFAPYADSVASAELFQGKITLPQTALDRQLKVVDRKGVDAKYKVIRGGSWKSDPFSTTTYHRNYSWPHYASDFFGFRCVTDVSESEGAEQ